MTVDEINTELEQISGRLATIRGETVLLNERLAQLRVLLHGDKTHGTFGTIDPPGEFDYWTCDITSELD